MSVKDIDKANNGSQQEGVCTQYTNTWNTTQITQQQA